MKDNLTFTLLGGDMRQSYLAKLLCADGHTVQVLGLDRLTFPPEIKKLDGPHQADGSIVVLPMPAMQDASRINAPLSNSPQVAEALFAQLSPGTLVLGGGVPTHIAALASQHQLQLVDYLHREELAILNAIPTAEGAIQIAMEELPFTLHGCSCLVIGYGRIGKILSRMLRALGAEVAVAARKWEDFAGIRADGNRPVPSAPRLEDLGGYSLLINTVPTQILARAQLKQTDPDCLILDLASKPGGVDLTAAQQCQRKVIWALSLPGKVAPVTSAQAIRDTIYHILQEKEHAL